MKPKERSLLSTLASKQPFAPFLLVLVSAMAAVAAYLQALDYPFVSDDARYLTENIKLAGLPLAKLWRLFTEPYNDFSEFLPLREFSYWFDMTLFGLNPAAFRLHNILLYLLCLPLVYATTLELWRYFRPADATSAPWAAATVTALFALHPALVESVVWISGRKYVLPNLFSMLALWLAMRARRKQGLSAPQAVATLVAFVAVMLSKSSFVAVAPLIALLWLLFWLDAPKPGRRYSQLLWPLAILLLAGLLTLVFIVKNNGVQTLPFYFEVDVIIRLLSVLGWLARLAVSPESRHFFYPVLDGPYLSVMVFLGGTVLSTVAVGGVMLLRKRPLEGFALVAFLLLCLPYMQLVPHVQPSLVQDRYLTLAAWPVVLLLVTLSWRLKPVPRMALLLAIALSWGFQTVERTRDWRSQETLENIELRTYPGHYLPSMYVINNQLRGWLFHDAAETANSITVPEVKNAMVGLVKAAHAVRIKTVKTGTPHEAMVLLQSLELMLKQPPVQAKWNTPMIYVWDFCQDKLSLQWEHLAEQFPDDATVRYNTGLWMLHVRNYEDAAVHLRIAIESQHLPESVRGTAFKNLGFALMNSGHVVEAEVPLRAALVQSPPDLRVYCLLSKVYKQTNQIGEAAHAKASCPGDTQK